MTPMSNVPLGRFTFGVLGGAQTYTFDLERFNAEGLFALQGDGVSGAGLIQVTYALSLNGVDFVTQSGTILANVSGASRLLESISPKPARYIKFTFTANTTVVADFWLHVR